VFLFYSNSRGIGTVVLKRSEERGVYANDHLFVVFIITNSIHQIRSDGYKIEGVFKRHSIS
jgi:hypothetical protein